MSRRFDPDSSSVEYSLDDDKISYAKKYFQMHLTDGKINTTILDESPVPVNGFLTPPNVADSVEDIYKQ